MSPRSIGAWTCGVFIERSGRSLSPGAFAARAVKPLVFVLASLPALLLLTGALGLANTTLGPNPVREMLHVTGKTALNLLIITLLASPLRMLTGSLVWQKPRRMLGLFAFGYAMLHFLVYAILELELDLGDLAREISRRPFIIVGTVALLLMLPLAITSTDRMMRRLGRRWQSLHRLVYPIAILGVWHYYWQVKADVREPLLYAGALVVLLGWRYLGRPTTMKMIRRKSTSARAASRE